MDTIAAPVQSFNMQEPIPGYRLRERIGAGGYGEVWLADAPGELSKAVKIVYGPLSAQRAETELKALQRIKQVQHPLLLSLERYEIVDEHLIIVTELAHGSLKDRFEEHVEAGHRGIPRAELLAYLRDVADALDYLYEKHSLQHLDVKPENLLLIADRVKVADFGLVKDLQDDSQSLVGGLTPLYAPPEIFDGRPNKHSDQYSLAIVYQELLTGEPPFAGRTVAQLAAQHLHSNPCLSALPRSDQAIIARALSKDPARRFPNCRKLVDSLADAHRTTQRSQSDSRSTRAARTPTESIATKTVMLDAEPIKFPVDPAIRWLAPLNPEASQSVSPQSAPPADRASQAVSHQPCVFIGVGGFGGKVLQQLRRRLCERFGNVDDLPALQMLLIDTDSQMLTRAAQGEHTTALRGNQLLPIPLRQPSDYRNDSGAILEWLNRRWLYNIPRSLLTEGIRPLGRLAFVDHYANIAEALQHAIASATSKDAIERSSQHAGVSFQAQTPRVFVLGTSSGGTSSGCILDLGYTVRAVLSDLGLADTSLYGLLAHGIPRKAAARDLAIANTLGLLNEYRRYTSADGYPGEPACGLSASLGGTPPFEHTYFVSLGEDVGPGVVPVETHLAEYVYQSCSGRAAAALDASRASADEPSDPGSLRTFGIHRIGGTEGDFVLAQSDAVCRRLISQWAGQTKTRGQDSTTTHDPAVEELAKKFAQSLDLRIDRIIAGASDAVSQEVRGDTKDYFRSAIADIRADVGLHQGVRDEALVCQKICKQIDALIFPTDEQQPCLQQSVRARLRGVAERKVETLQDWLAILIDAPSTRVAGARDAVSWIRDHLDGIEQRFGQELAAANSDLDLVIAVADDESLERYAHARLRQLILESAAVFVCLLKAEAERNADLLYEFTTRLRQLENEFSAATIDAEAMLPALAKISRTLQARQREMAQQLDRRMAPDLVNKEISLSALLTAGSDVWMRLVGTMRTTATTLVGGVITRLQVATAVEEDGNTETTPLPKQAVTAATPEMLECGGAARFLLVAPSSADEWPENWHRSFAEAAGTTPDVILDSGESITVCCEAEDLPLKNVVVKIAGGRSDFYAAAARLQTRIDVEWPRLAEWVGGETE